MKPYFVTLRVRGCRDGPGHLRQHFWAGQHTWLDDGRISSALIKSDEVDTAFTRSVIGVIKVESM